MTRLALFASLCLLVIPACKKKDDAAASAGGAAPAAGKTADKPADKPAAGSPVKTDPKALFDEFSETNKVDPMKLIEKYHDGATFSAKVAVKGAEETGKPILWVDVDGKNHITLDYTDVNQAKAVKDGDTVTVTCKIGGEMGTTMMVTDCVAAK
jgi:hypothetical protein